MSIEPITPAETDLERIDGLLADLGTITRRAANEALTEEDFRVLSRRMRSRLQALRAEAREAQPFELTDVAAAIATASQVGQSPELRSLIRRIPGLMTAQQLACHPGVGRARMYGDFAVIDGGARDGGRP